MPIMDYTFINIFCTRFNVLFGTGLRVEDLREALHMFCLSRYASGEEMVTRMKQRHHGIPLEVPPLADGVIRQCLKY